MSTPHDRPLDLLCVAAHPDDAEISVGGTLAKAVAEGLRVGIIDLTTGEPTPRGDEATRAAETAAATEVLGVHWRDCLKLPNRRLREDDTGRRALAEVFRLTRPKLLLAPYWQDVHPDHVAASALCDAARFWSKLSRSDLCGDPFWPPQMLHYWSLHLRLVERPSVVVDVSGTLETKLEAARCYRSQLDLNRDSSAQTGVLADIEARARYWGWSISAQYGEPLFSREQIPTPSVRGLISLWSN